MNNVWLMETNGEPLVALRSFVENTWQQAHLDGLVVSGDTLEKNGDQAVVLETPDLLDQVNPFRPAMTHNNAKLVPGILKQHPDQRLGALLRPCEMRALAEMHYRRPFERERLLTFCVDCLGTYPAEDVAWRSERMGLDKGLADNSLRFARQGGIAQYRFRTACQVCRSPQAEGAEINLGVLGLPARQHFLVEINSPEILHRLTPDDAQLFETRPDLIEARQRVLGRMTSRSSQTRDLILSSLVEHFHYDLDRLARQLDNCHDCQACFDSCPICSVERPQRDSQGRYKRRDLARWLVSCAGCGMCEQACTSKLPLSAIFGFIRSQLQRSSESFNLAGL